MKVVFWYSGSENPDYLEDGIAPLNKRIQKYIPFEHQLLSLGKVKDPEKRMEKEKDAVLKALKPGDYLILLDENGQSFTSQAFAVYLQQCFNQGHQRLIFLAGSSHGFHKELKQNAHGLLALSQMTFNHEHIRLIFTEQLYRALTIIHNEPYHH